MGKSLRGKRLKRLGLFWMGVFLSFSLWAQTGVICGTVTDAKMKEPLIGASVVIEGTTVGAITDIDGNFRIENVKPGTYTVAASYVSYQTQTVKDVPVVARQEAVLNIELSDANLQLQNVVVVAQRKLGTEMPLKESLQKKTEQCVEERKHLRYKIRADRPEEEIQEMKEQIKVLTEKIGTLRKEAALCDGIAARSKVIEEKFKMMREEKEKKEEQSHEHIRRSR